MTKSLDHKCLQLYRQWLMLFAIVGIVLSACSGPDNIDLRSTPSVPTLTVKPQSVVTVTTVPEPTLRAEASEPGIELPSPTARVTTPTTVPTESVSTSPPVTATFTASPEPTSGHVVLFGSKSYEYNYPAVAIYLASGISDEAAVQFLAGRPYLPWDTQLFSPNIYGSSSSFGPPGTGPPKTEVELEQELRLFLESRFPGTPDQVANAIVLFSEDILRVKIPDPNLRAALISLTGTIYDPVVPLFLDTFSGIEYADMPDFGQSNTEVDENGFAQNRIYINQKYMHESFVVLSAIVAHELVHEDVSNSIHEEYIAHILETTLYAQQLLTAPDVVFESSHMAQWQNALVLGRLMSGKGAQLGMYDANGLIVPGSNQSDHSFVAFLERILAVYESPLPADSPGTPVLVEILGGLAEEDTQIPQEPAFDPSTLDFLNENLAVIGPREVVALACVLQLSIAECAP